MKQTFPSCVTMRNINVRGNTVLYIYVGSTVMLWKRYSDVKGKGKRGGKAKESVAFLADIFSFSSVCVC